jgi:hypothetical protein
MSRFPSCWTVRASKAQTSSLSAAACFKRFRRSCATGRLPARARAAGREPAEVQPKLNPGDKDGLLLLTGVKPPRPRRPAAADDAPPRPAARPWAGAAEAIPRSASPGPGTRSGRRGGWPPEARSGTATAPGRARPGRRQGWDRSSTAAAAAGRPPGRPAQTGQVGDHDHPAPRPRQVPSPHHDSTLRAHHSSVTATHPQRNCVLVRQQPLVC